MDKLTDAYPLRKEGGVDKAHRVGVWRVDLGGVSRGGGDMLTSLGHRAQFPSWLLWSISLLGQKSSVTSITSTSGSTYFWERRASWCRVVRARDWKE